MLCQVNINGKRKKCAEEKIVMGLNLAKEIHNLFGRQKPIAGWQVFPPLPPPQQHPPFANVRSFSIKLYFDKAVAIAVSQKASTCSTRTLYHSVQLQRAQF